MKLFHALVLIWVTFGLAQTSLAATQGPAAFFQKIDRQLCANFKSTKCHRKHRSHVVPKTKVEKTVVPPQAPVAPQVVPKPTLKPDVPQLPKAPAVLPPERPHIATLEPAVLPTAKPPAPDSIHPPDNASCLAALKAKHVDFDSVGQPPGLPSCIVVQPVQLKSVLVNGANIQLPDHPILNCAFAVNFVSWLQDLGGPAAIAKEGSAITQFWTGPGYQCRGRNGDISAKISEHGFGNAVDIERLKFSDGLMILVHDAPDTTAPGYDVLKAIRASACLRFTTVLGPGSNDAHREHFHFDSGVHGKSGTYKICE